MSPKTLTLCKAAIQATARAMHAAQLAVDYTEGETAAAFATMRDLLIDAYRGVPEPMRRRIMEPQATITADELLSILAHIVRGDSKPSKTTTTKG